MALIVTEIIGIGIGEGGDAAVDERSDADILRSIRLAAEVLDRIRNIIEPGTSLKFKKGGNPRPA